MLLGWGRKGWSIPSGSGGRCVGRPRGQRIGLDLRSRRCRRRLKQSAGAKIRFTAGTKPLSSAMNKDRPMPTGAMNVALCFSAASMKIVKTSWAVRNISMKRPRVMEVPILSAVRTSRGPGNSTLTTAAAVMAPRICDTVRSIPRIYVNAPTRHIPSVTAGLKSPPEMRKNTQALTAREKPKDRLMYRS